MSLRSFLLLCLASSSLASLAAAKPNIIFILADDLGYADLSCYGADKIKTPHLDRMATEGVKFTDCYATDCYATGCVCSPTRGSLNREGLPSAIREGNWKLHLVAPVMKWAGKLPPEALLEKSRWSLCPGCLICPATSVKPATSRHNTPRWLPNCAPTSGRPMPH
ncbi:MAG: sulfatase-like hydrolase/transferase [Verrucomicrobiota bacterium]